MQPSPEFKNLLAFVVLMAGLAVLDKSPDYIMEKFHRYTGGACRQGDGYLWGLDGSNRGIFNAYLIKWFGEDAADESVA